MGQSTNAILAFGFDLGELNDANWQVMLDGKLADCDYDVEAFLLDDFGSDADCAQDITKVPIDIITHCSNDYPMYFLAVRGTKRVATRGHPTDIDTSMYGVENAEKQRAMKAFCNRHDIPWQEPKWHIFSMWG